MGDSDAPLMRFLGFCGLGDEGGWDRGARAYDPRLRAALMSVLGEGDWGKPIGEGVGWPPGRLPNVVNLGLVPLGGASTDSENFGGELFGCDGWFGESLAWDGLEPVGVAGVGFEALALILTEGGGVLGVSMAFGTGGGVLHLTGSLASSSVAV